MTSRGFGAACACCVLLATNAVSGCDGAASPQGVAVGQSDAVTGMGDDVIDRLASKGYAVVGADRVHSGPGLDVWLSVLDHRQKGQDLQCLVASRPFVLTDEQAAMGLPDLGVALTISCGPRSAVDDDGLFFSDTDHQMRMLGVGRVPARLIGSLSFESSLGDLDFLHVDDRSFSFLLAEIERFELTVSGSNGEHWTVEVGRFR